MKKRNITFPLVRYFTWKLELMSNILSMIVSGSSSLVLTRPRSLQTRCFLTILIILRSFLWIVDASVITKETIELHKQWVEGVISLKIPNSDQYQEFYEVLKTSQLRSHLKTYRNKLKMLHAGFILVDIFVRKL